MDKLGRSGVDAPLGFGPWALGFVVVDREVALSGPGCRHPRPRRQPEGVVPVMNGHEEFLLAARAQGHVLEPAEASEAKRILLEALHRLGVPALRSAVCHAWEVIKGNFYFAGQYDEGNFSCQSFTNVPFLTDVLTNEVKK